MSRHRRRHRSESRQQEIEEHYILHTIPDGVEREGLALSKNGLLWVKNAHSSGMRNLSIVEMTQLRDALTICIDLQVKPK